MLEKLRKPRYKGKLEGLEECLPRFVHADIVLWTGKPRMGGGGGNRSRRYRSALKQRLEAWKRLRV